MQTARRRAEELARLLDGEPGPASDRYAELVAVAGRLQAVDSPAPRPEFVAGLRERLMAEADSALAPLGDGAGSRPAPARVLVPRRRADRRVAVLLGAAAMVGATGSVAAAAQGSLPGDSLYPVKRVLEAARSGVTVSDESKGELLLAQAGSRLDEVAELAGRDDAESRRSVAPTLEEFGSQAGEAADLLVAEHLDSGRRSPVLALLDFTGDSMARLDEISRLLPADDATRESLTAAAAELFDIEADARAACPDCTGGVSEVPRFLASGGLAGGEIVPVSDLMGAATSPSGVPVGPAETARVGEAPESSPAVPTPSSTATPTATPSGAPTTGSPAPTDPGPSSGPAPSPGPTAAQSPNTSAVPQTPRETPTATPKPPLEAVKETLVGTDPPATTPADGSTPSEQPSGGVVGGVGELLGEVAGGLLGEGAGQGVRDTTGGLGKLLGGLLTPTGRGPRP